MSSSIPWGERNSTLSSESFPHEASNLAKVVAMAATLVRHVETMVVEVELVFVTGRL